MASRSTSRLRRFSRFSCLVVFAAIGLSCAFRSLGAEAEYFLAKHSLEEGQALLYLHRAARLWPYDYQMRTTVAYYWASTRLYAAHAVAIPELEAELATNPNAADLWLALASYQAASGASPDEAMKHVQALRPGGRIKMEVVDGLEGD